MSPIGATVNSQACQRLERRSIHNSKPHRGDRGVPAVNSLPPRWGSSTQLAYFPGVHTPGYYRSPRWGWNRSRFLLLR
jgi:hypothetical protein